LAIAAIGLVTALTGLKRQPRPELALGTTD
jgi:hypothetical protein